MSVDEAQGAKPSLGCPEPPDFRQHDAARGPDHDVFDLTRPVNQRAHLASADAGRLGQTPRELGTDDFIDRYPTAVNAFERFERAGCEPLFVAMDFHGSRRSAPFRPAPQDLQRGAEVSARKKAPAGND